jgi:hypothetical protein
LSLLGLHFNLQIGPTVPVPVPEAIISAVQSVEVTHKDDGRSGFQIVLSLRRGPADYQDYALLQDPLIEVGNRVVMGLTVAGVPSVLFDGFITNQQFKPSMTPGTSTLTLTGEDASYQMDLEELPTEHPSMSDDQIVTEIIGKYANIGVVAQVTKPDGAAQPTEDERTSGQQGTDYKLLTDLATRYGFAFYVVPGPTSGVSTAVWGPPVREGSPQAALSMNLGAETNLDSIDFTVDGVAATLFKGRVQDRTDNSAVDISTSSLSRSTLASADALRLARIRAFRQSGADGAQAQAEAQAQTDASVAAAVTATGELDTGRYGGILQARRLVDVRGVGFLFDGTWYVKSVTHKIARGSYKQSFALAREAKGSTSSTATTQ